jgi:DNA polymerase-3 subunit epsilon
MYAIVDIETTGGSARLEKITEIAIYLHDGEKITGEFITLVNPGRNIPYFITNLTGITNEMVEKAPRFHEIAREIIEITDGRTLVAHNARFDYSFIRQEYKSLGYNYKRNIIDTVSLSRKLLPGHSSYSLGNICRDLNINITGRHRAGNDALATVRLFELLLGKDSDINGNKSQLVTNTKISKLNPSLDISKIDSIPEEPGVYYFYNDKKEVIYVGKSRNLKHRISSHLSNNSNSRAMEMRDLIADVDYDLTGSELVALLRESLEIKTKKPLYNRSQRRTRFQWGIFSFTDDQGYINFMHGPANNEKNHLALFSSKERAKAKLAALVVSHNLCQKKAGLYDSPGSCFHFLVGICKGACNGSETPARYNERAARAVEEFEFAWRNFFIIDNGRNPDERSVVKVINGKYTGHGYFNINDMGFGLSAIHDCITRYPDNRDIQVILKQYLRDNKIEKIIEF